MSLFAEISNPKMKYKKLEISSCGLGNVEIMTLLCRELKKQQMIEELSLPYNEIRKDSLKILLDTVTLCKKIKYLGLNNNEINEDCLEMIQSFISKSSHCILILNGNEVEQHAHLLEQQLLSHDNNDLEL
jgi:Ran GTPase-activating protein (RanGAP) involved in mRNA processing and transport